MLAVRLASVGGESAMTSDVVLRWVRALTLASVVFTSGLAGHAAGGGLIPAASVLVSLFVLTVVAVAPFARAPVRPAAAVALLVGGQGLLHAALQLLVGLLSRRRPLCVARIWVRWLRRRRRPAAT